MPFGRGGFVGVGGVEGRCLQDWRGGGGLRKTNGDRRVLLNGVEGRGEKGTARLDVLGF